MLSIIIALAAGLLVGFVSPHEWGLGWAITCGLAAFVIVLPVIGLLLRSRINAQQQQIQKIMMQAQEQINRRLTMLQRRASDPAGARSAVEKIQQEAVRRALAETDKFRPFYKWNILLERQINTLRVQLLFQLKEYKKVDELLKKSLLLDPQSIAIQLVRMYRNKDSALDKFFQRRSRRLKGEAAAFVASVYAWIKLHSDPVGSAEALAALRSAARTSDHQVLQENIERLVNGKVKHFSNSGFGDVWYALGLEEPKVKMQRQPGYGRPF